MTSATTSPLGSSAYTEASLLESSTTHRKPSIRCPTTTPEISSSAWSAIVPVTVLSATRGQDRSAGGADTCGPGDGARGSFVHATSELTEKTSSIATIDGLLAERIVMLHLDDMQSSCSWISSPAKHPPTDELERLC